MAEVATRSADFKKAHARSESPGLAGKWLARTLRAEIDEDRIEAYRGTVSLPFAAGAHRRVAVKVVDDRGIESLRILELE